MKNYDLFWKTPKLKSVQSAELRSNNLTPRLEFSSVGTASIVTPRTTPRKNNTPIHYYYETNNSFSILSTARKLTLGPL